jgi:hypothetical protein
LAKVQLTSITTISSRQYDVHDLRVYLPLWSSIFPNLNKLKIHSTPFRRSRDVLLALIEDLIEKCPQIQVVVINRIGGTLEDWRCGKERFIGSPPRDQGVGWSLKLT